MAFSTKISTSNQSLARMTQILFRFFGHRLISDCKQKLDIFLYGKTFTVLKNLGRYSFLHINPNCAGGNVTAFSWDLFNKD